MSGLCLDLVILEVFSTQNYSMIVWQVWKAGGIDNLVHAFLLKLKRSFDDLDQILQCLLIKADSCLLKITSRHHSRDKTKPRSPDLDSVSAFESHPISKHAHLFHLPIL